MVIIAVLYLRVCDTQIVGRHIHIHTICYMSHKVVIKLARLDVSSEVLPVRCNA